MPNPQRTYVIFVVLMVVHLCPIPITAREWTDVTGKYRLEADLVAVEGENARLKKPDGGEVVVPVNRLSEQDRRFIAAQAEATRSSTDADSPFVEPIATEDSESAEMPKDIRQVVAVGIGD